jgi:extracellular elastinolytic metalloproteinase
MVRQVDKRDPSFIKGRPERQDEVIAVADGVAERLGLQRLAVARLNPATATVAELRFSGGTPSADERRILAHGCVEATRAALGSIPEDVVEFVPDPVVQRTSGGAEIVHLRQMYRGIPVFQMTRTVTVTPEGRVAKVKGDHAPLPATLDIVPVIDPVRAVQAASAFLAVPERPGGAARSALREVGTPTVVAAFALPSQPTVLDANPFVGLTPAHLVVFYQGPAARLGWHIQLSLPPTETSFGEQYELVITADKSEPDTLFCQPTAHSVVEGEIYARDPVRTPRARVPFPVPGDSYRLPVLPAQFPKDWCVGDETVGGNVRAITETTSQPARGTRTGSDVLFVSPDDDSDDQHLINAFYFCNYLHDFFELLGFDEAAGNFEAGSATATGPSGDPVVVVITHARPLWGGAYMTPSADGRSPTLGLGTHAESKRHGALDFTVVAHEYTHGVTQRLIGGPGDATALTQPQSAGVAEGMSDFFALSIVNSSLQEGDVELQVVGEWFADKTDGLRHHRYDASYPGTYGALRTSDEAEPHDIGEVWCATMMEVVRRWSAHFGTDAYRRCWQVVLDSLKVVKSPPSFLDARDALEEALDFMRDSGELSEDDHAVARRLLWETFARFGMGFGATTNGAWLPDIVESTQIPPRLG